MTSQKPLLAVVAALVGYFASFPGYLHDAAIGALIMIVVDTLTGFSAAIVCRRVSSNNARVLLAAKATQYAILATMGGVADLLAHGASFRTAVAWSVIAIEFLSMLENLTRLQQVGVNLGPAGPVLERLAHFFSVNTAPNEAPITPLESLTDERTKP